MQSPIPETVLLRVLAQVPIKKNFINLPIIDTLCVVQTYLSNKNTDENREFGISVHSTQPENLELVDV